jgi:hypothetical protein
VALIFRRHVGNFQKIPRNHSPWTDRRLIPIIQSFNVGKSELIPIFTEWHGIYKMLDLDIVETKLNDVYTLRCVSGQRKVVRRHR